MVVKDAIALETVTHPEHISPPSSEVQKIPTAESATEHNNDQHGDNSGAVSSEHGGEGGHHVVLTPDVLTHIGSLPITNTLVTSWLVMVIIIGLSLLATRNMRRVPSGMQNFMEMVVEGVYSLSQELAHDKVKYFFPLLMTFFLLIVVSNWFGLLPGVMTITTKVGDHMVPLIRPVNTDLNMTLGLALISVAATHFYAVKFLGVGGYLKKWFSLNPIMLFVGILELVSEVTKTISLSFRLFGNIFAGEVVLTTISGLFAFIAPLPFYLLEVLVGVVQAAVFMMLTLVFMVVLSDKHEAH